MLNHTYTSVKNANLVDCGKKQHIPSQPTPLLKENFLGEFRTELDKKKVLAALGIATELSLEWGNIKGDIGDSPELIKELDARTKYTSSLDNIQKTIGEGIAYLETIVGNDKTKDDEQDDKIANLIENLSSLETIVSDLSKVLSTTTDSTIPNLSTRIDAIDKSINNITALVTVSEKTDNALQLITEEGVEGLYVPDLDPRVSAIEQNVSTVEEKVIAIEGSLDSFVTKDDLGGDGTYDFVDQQTYNAHVQSVTSEISTIKSDLSNTVKTGEDGHVDTLFVNKISKDNEGNIEVTDSFEVTTDKPLDVRFVRETLDDLLALPVDVCYEGMGVIVNSLSSLYILKKPESGKLTQEYISDIYNWKCPEDLVTVAMTQTDYDNLEEKNPNVFYYIYEEEITRTQEPKREEYISDEEFQVEWEKWVKSLKTLSQEYMSASWGVDIESKLGKKANQTDINALDSNIKDLQEQIDLIRGGTNEDSVSSIANRLKITESELDYLLGTEGTDEEPSSEGKISEIENSISGLNKTIVEDYVSIDSITTENNNTNYIFVKKSEYESDKLIHDQAIAESVTTDNIHTNNINLSNLPVTSNGTDLLINDKEVALVEEVPVIIYLTQAEYDNLASSGELDPEAYYYTTNEEIYVTKTEFDTKTTQINTSINAANAVITALNKTVEQLQSHIDALYETMQNLQNRITILEGTSEEEE